MGAALDRIDVVGERKNVFGIAVVPLHGDFDADAVFLALEMNDLWMDRALGPIEMLDKRQKSAFVEKLMVFLRALVFDGNFQAAIEES